MDYNDLVEEIFKVLVGAIFGGLITIWYKDHLERKKEKHNFFIRMLSYRGHLSVPQQLIDDLNVISILFKGNKGVIEKWKVYFDFLSNGVQQSSQKQRDLHNDLLREIGSVVGHKNLDNKFLSEGYLPDSVYSSHTYNQEYQKEILAFLKTGNLAYEKLVEVLSMRQGLKEDIKQEDQP